MVEEYSDEQLQAEVDALTKDPKKDTKEVKKDVEMTQEELEEEEDSKVEDVVFG